MGMDSKSKELRFGSHSLPSLQARKRALKPQNVLPKS